MEPSGLYARLCHAFSSLLLKPEFKIWRTSPKGDETCRIFCKIVDQPNVQKSYRKFFFRHHLLIADIIHAGIVHWEEVKRAWVDATLNSVF